MKKLFCFCFIFISLCVLSSCSVVMAAKKDGTNISKVQQCKTRNQFICLGGKIINSDRMPNGDLIEVYQFKNERGSAARALMHGVLDVATLGIWEAVGTPIEGLDKVEYFCVKVWYDENEYVKGVSLS